MTCRLPPWWGDGTSLFCFPLRPARSPLASRTAGRAFIPFAGLWEVPLPLYPASCRKTAATVGRFSRLRVPNPTEKHYLCPQRWFRHADRQPHPSVTGLKGNAVRIGDSSRCCKFRFSPVRGPHRGPSATRENHTVTTLSATGPRGAGKASRQERVRRPAFAPSPDRRPYGE